MSALIRPARGRKELADFGRVHGDGFGDDTPAFVAAQSYGGEVYCPLPAVRYRVTDTIEPASGTVFIANGAPLKMDSAATATLFDLSGKVGAGVVGFVIDGNKAVAPSAALIEMSGSFACRVEKNTITDAPATIYGSVTLSGAAKNNRVCDNRFIDSEGTAVSLSGFDVSHNQIGNNVFENSGAFGIRLGEGARRNRIFGNSTEANTLELIGVTSDCSFNRIYANHAAGCGDNGISISGFNNTVTGNVCRDNQKAGIWCWGSFNTVTGNECIANNQENAGNNWAGIGASANYGGCGQHNVIVGNITDDDQAAPTQFNGVRLAGMAYATWAAAAVVVSGEYRIYGLNVYHAAGAGSCGVTPPTHTAGDVSDGAVTWRYKRTFLTAAGNYYNTVAHNSAPRYANAAFTDVGGWVNNTLLSRDNVDQRASGNYRAGCGAAGAYWINVGGTDKVRCTANEFRPETDAAMSLGLATKQWANAHVSGTYYVDGLPVLSERRGGYVAMSGASDRASAFDAGTVTVAQLAKRVAALQADLTAHGLIGG